MSALDKPQVFRIGFDSLKGSILIYREYGRPEKPKSIEGFKGYDKLTLDDGTVFHVKISRP